MGKHLHHLHQSVGKSVPRKATAHPICKIFRLAAETSKSCGLDPTAEHKRTGRGKRPGRSFCCCSGSAEAQQLLGQDEDAHDQDKDAEPAPQCSFRDASGQPGADERTQDGGDGDSCDQGPI